MRPLDIGLRPGTSDAEARRIRVLNLLTWIAVVTPLLWCVPALLLDRWPVAVFNVVLSASCGATFALSSPRTRTWIAITLATTILVGHHWLILGPGVAVHAWFVPLVGLPFVIFDPDRDKAACVFWVVVEIALFALGELEVSFVEPLAPFPQRAAAVGSVVNSVTAASVLVLLVAFFARLSARAERALAGELDRSERLLLNVLPAPIAGRLKSGEAPLADYHPAATVLFADIAGFTPLAKALPPQEVVALLSELFGRFDRLTAAAGLEKIKTIGDAYMVAAGIPEPRDDHADAAAALALEMLAATRALAAEHGVGLDLRIGLHSGEIVAGVIGQSKFAYDLWGDTVNVASRMESHGEAGRIQVSAATAALVAERFRCEPRGRIEVAGHGPIDTLWLVGGPSARPDAADRSG